MLLTLGEYSTAGSWGRKPSNRHARRGTALSAEVKE